MGKPQALEGILREFSLNESESLSISMALSPSRENSLRDGLISLTAASLTYRLAQFSLLSQMGVWLLAARHSSGSHFGPMMELSFLVPVPF